MSRNLVLEDESSIVRPRSWESQTFMPTVPMTDPKKSHNRADGQILSATIAATNRGFEGSAVPVPAGLHVVEN